MSKVKVNTSYFYNDPHFEFDNFTNYDVPNHGSTNFGNTFFFFFLKEINTEALNINAYKIIYSLVNNKIV